ncbi:MAG TPA: hypothetical protein VFU46_07215 [Gemmatimonadales bacterium]|nr:hypothetical protein [Gemmatimonadales bacterium]
MIRFVVPALLLVALAGPGTVAAQEPGAIRPGMTETEVKAAWGEPLARRTRGDFTYLHYETDCLRACGTYDVVILEGGQVVDAIARSKNHRYDGVSSSPADREPHYTAPRTP